MIISYDDSDGWYDHAFSGVTNPSASVADALTGTGMCGTGTPLAGQQRPLRLRPAAAAAGRSRRGRSATSSRHTLTDQSSIIKFVEDNWFLPRIPGSVDAITGSIDDMFQFYSYHHRLTHPENGKPFILSPVTGQLVARWQ